MRVNISSHSGTARLSIKEAAVLSGVTEKIVRHELSARIVRPVRKAGRHVELPVATALYLALTTRLPVELDRTDRRDLFELLVRELATRGRWKRVKDRLILDGGVPIIVPLAETAREMATRLRWLERGRQRISEHPDTLGGDAVFAGTRLSVRHVGELTLRGTPEAELLEDFPALSRADLGFARMFVELGRPPGRPRRLRLERA